MSLRSLAPLSLAALLLLPAPALAEDDLPRHAGALAFSTGNGATVETIWPDGTHRTVLPGVKGRVAHCPITDVDQDVAMYRAGIEFIEPSERVYAVILEFLESIKAGRRAE